MVALLEEQDFHTIGLAVDRAWVNLKKGGEL
jgi:hypothetical protein